MTVLRAVHFPPPIGDLLRSLSKVGFFERSLLIGSWVMPIYQELYGAPYVLRTLDIDFAVHLAHPQIKMRADLERLITDLGLLDFVAAEGVQKFTAAGYEVEFIAHRPGGRQVGSLAVREWNLNALPLPFIKPLLDFSEVAALDDFTIRFPLPEAFFVHKLIIAHRRLTEEKRQKDLEQCATLAPVLSDERLHRVMQSQRLGKETRRQLARSCEMIDFPLQKADIDANL
ncbi:MAG: GSU2403 family nucleotidyltransferase fold protein [Desulfuromonadales bacterium]